MKFVFSAVDIDLGRVRRLAVDYTNFHRLVRRPQFIVGIEKLAPSLMPDGQREVTVLVLV